MPSQLLALKFSGTLSVRGLVECGGGGGGAKGRLMRMQEHKKCAFRKFSQVIFVEVVM